MLTAFCIIASFFLAEMHTEIRDSLCWAHKRFFTRLPCSVDDFRRWLILKGTGVAHLQFTDLSVLYFRELLVALDS